MNWKNLLGSWGSNKGIYQGSNIGWVKYCKRRRRGTGSGSTPDIAWNNALASWYDNDWEAEICYSSWPGGTLDHTGSIAWHPTHYDAGINFSKLRIVFNLDLPSPLIARVFFILDPPYSGPDFSTEFHFKKLFCPQTGAMLETPLGYGEYNFGIVTSWGNPNSEFEFYEDEGPETYKPTNTPMMVDLKGFKWTSGIVIRES